MKKKSCEFLFFKQQFILKQCFCFFVFLITVGCAFKNKEKDQSEETHEHNPTSRPLESPVTIPAIR